MKNIILRIGITAVVCGIGVGVWLIGCGGKGNGPVEPKDYYVYFADGIQRENYYRYHTGTGEVESFTLPYDSWECGMGISPDGSTMYLNPEDRIVEVSLDSLTIMAEHQVDIKYHPSIGYEHGIEISPNGRYMALIDHYLHIIDLNDYSVVYRDTTHHFKYGRFSKYGEYFVCTGLDTVTNYGLALEINLRDNFADSIRGIRAGMPGRITLDSQNKRWFMLSHFYNDNWAFIVYDVEKDTLEYGLGICPGLGDIELTRDERYIIFSQANSWFVYCPAPWHFTVYDVNAREIDREVDTYVDSLGIVDVTRELCITPDGRHLIGTSQHSGLFDYDLGTQSFIRHVAFAGWDLQLLTCQCKK